MHPSTIPLPACNSHVLYMYSVDRRSYHSDCPDTAHSEIASRRPIRRPTTRAYRPSCPSVASTANQLQPTRIPTSPQLTEAPFPHPTSVSQEARLID